MPLKKIISIRYLLTSDELKEHANIYSNNSKPFTSACVHSNQKVLEYLINNYKIEYNQDIKDYLLKYSHPIAEKLFQARELMDELGQNNSSIRVKHHKL